MHPWPAWTPWLFLTAREILAGVEMNVLGLALLSPVTSMPVTTKHDINTYFRLSGTAWIAAGFDVGKDLQEYR